MGVSFALHPRQHLLLVVLVLSRMLTGVTLNLSVVLICISFMGRDGEHFFMCFCSFVLLHLKKILFSSVAHFFIGSLILGEFSFLNSYIFWLSVLCLMYI
jgi:hypothetical protein